MEQCKGEKRMKKKFNTIISDGKTTFPLYLTKEEDKLVLEFNKLLFRHNLIVNIHKTKEKVEKE